MKALLRKLRWLRRRQAMEAELQEELQFHLEEEASERRAKGMADEAALRAAQGDLGNLALLKEDTRAIWTWTFGEQLLHEAERSAGFDRISGDPFECLDPGWLPACSNCRANRADDRTAARVTLSIAAEIEDPRRRRKRGRRFQLGWRSQ